MQSLKINLTELTFETLKSVFSENYQTVSFTRMQEDGKEGNVYKDAIFAPSIYAGESTEIRDEKDFNYIRDKYYSELVILAGASSNVQSKDNINEVFQFIRMKI